LFRLYRHFDPTLPPPPSPLAAAGVKEEKPTLTIDVLMHALRQKGVNIYKPSIIKVCCAVARRWQKSD
jgi:hypothetical protein